MTFILVSVTDMEISKVITSFLACKALDSCWHSDATKTSFVLALDLILEFRLLDLRPLNLISCSTMYLFVFLDLLDLSKHDYPRLPRFY